MRCGFGSCSKKTVEKYGGRCRIRVVNNPILEEDSDNRRFLADVERWIGVPIEFAINKRYPTCSCVDVWSKERYMSGVRGAKCTQQLKKEARYQFEDANKIDWHVLGFTVDEKGRYERFVKTERPNTLPILIESDLTKGYCFQLLQEAGISLPNIYKMGYPNANCIGCVKSGSPTYWNHVRRMHPHVFNERAKQSRELKVRLVKHKGKRLFLDELPSDAKGREMKSLRQAECGIFCEEKF